MYLVKRARLHVLLKDDIVVDESLVQKIADDAVACVVPQRLGAASRGDERRLRDSRHSCVASEQSNMTTIGLPTFGSEVDIKLVHDSQPTLT
jgi:hypothetical protein